MVALFALCSTDEGECEENCVAGIKEEIAVYRGLPIVKYKDASPLEWWPRNCRTMPLLANPAKMYLCVPAASCPSERVFSLAGGIVSERGAALKPENVNIRCFLASNL